jgi:hypothetical protein
MEIPFYLLLRDDAKNFNIFFCEGGKIMDFETLFLLPRQK